MRSFEGKTNNSGWRYIDRHIVYKDSHTPLIIKKHDDYAHQVIAAIEEKQPFSYMVREKGETKTSYDHTRVKYVRIVRKEIRGKIRYFADLVISGYPPSKEKTIGRGNVGLDIGTSSLAISSRTNVSLVNLADEVQSISDKIRLVQKKIDRSKRAMNPAHFHTDGQPTWRMKETIEKAGITYGTHSLGPILDWFQEPIHMVNCLGSGAHTIKRRKSNDTTVMMCRTVSGNLIRIRLDLISNRPHNMAYYTLQGTKGVYESPRVPGETHRVWLEDFSNDKEKWQPLSDFYADFLPDDYIYMPEVAKDAGHWGPDYFMIQAFIESICEGRPVPIDIYQSLNYTLPGIISEKSMLAGGQQMEVPIVTNWGEREF